MTAVARDPERVGASRYPTIAILLHWLIAAAIVLQVVLSWRMGGRTPEAFAITQLHKSIGITILLLSLARLGWRLVNPPPPTLPETIARWERLLVRAVHVGFYVVMIGMPLTGWLMVSASRIAVPTMLYGAIPWPDIPGVGRLAAPAKAMWQGLGQTGHELLANFLYVLLALHVAGALRHQLFDADRPVLARMAPGAKAGRWLEPRILLIALAALGVIAFGALFNPPHPGMSQPPALAGPAPAAPVAEAEPPAAAVPAPVPAALPPGAAPAPVPAAPAEPVRWRIEPGSTLGFATAWSGQAIEGRFDHWQGDILFSPEALDRSKVAVTIDMGSAKTGDAQRDAILPSGDWLDGVDHPKAIYTADRFEKTGPDRYLAHGVLDLRGVRKPVDLPFHLHIVGDKAQVSGVTTLDRTVFGVGQGEWSATDQIPAKVTVRVNLQATRASG